MKKLATICAMLAAASSVQAFGWPKMVVEAEKPAAPEKKAKQQPSAHPVGETMTNSHTNNHCVVASADFLYWQTSEDGLEYALDNKVINPDPLTLDTKLRDLSFSWRPGFRVGIGYIFGMQDQWDLMATYTYMTGHAHGSFNPHLPISERPLAARWYPSVLGPLATEAEGSWNLHFNVVDLALGRDYFISKMIALHPFIGLRGAFIYQNYHAHYRGAFNTSAGTLFGNTSFKADNDFKAAGLRTGADFQWHFTSHWGLCSGISATLFYGRFDLSQQTNGLHLTGSGAGNSLVPVFSTATEKVMRTRANIDANIGLYWETMVNNRGHLTIALLYEISHWFQQNMLRETTQNFDSQPLAPGTISAIQPVTTNSQDGNLGLQGVTLKFRYDF